MLRRVPLTVELYIFKDEFMEIKNSTELDNWLFLHAQIQEHICDGIKGEVGGELVNVAYVDRDTGEKIYIEYDV
jgi:hypothetical protein